MNYDPRQSLLESGIDPNDVAAVANASTMQLAAAANAIERMRASDPNFDRYAPAIAEKLATVPGLGQMSEGGRPDLALKLAYDLARGEQQPGQSTYAPAWDSSVVPTVDVARQRFEQHRTRENAETFATARLRETLDAQRRELGRGWW